MLWTAYFQNAILNSVRKLSLYVSSDSMGSDLRRVTHELHQCEAIWSFTFGRGKEVRFNFSAVIKTNCVECSSDQEQKWKQYQPSTYIYAPSPPITHWYTDLRFDTLHKKNTAQKIGLMVRPSFKPTNLSIEDVGYSPFVFGTASLLSVCCSLG